MTRLVVALLVTTASAAQATDHGGPERVDWRNIRVLKASDKSVVSQCAFKGMAQDDDMEDLLKRARKIYGDTVVMSETMRGKDFVAEVYRCGK